MEKKFIGLIGGVIIAITAFLPWLSVMGIGVSGISGDSAAFGYAVIGFGALIAVFSFLDQKWSHILAIVFAVLEMGLMGLLILGASERASVDIAYGVWLGLLGAVVVIVGAIMAMRQPKEA